MSTKCLVTLAAFSAWLCSAAIVSATVIAYDPFDTDTVADELNGIYLAGANIQGASVEGGSIIGFSSSSWAGNSGLFDSVATGLASDSVDYESGGAARYGGNADGLVRAVRRSLDTYAGSDTYYISMLMRAEVVETNGAAFGGFNSGTDAFIADGYGIFFGFVGNGTGMDLVARQRENLGGGVYGLTNTVLAAAAVDTTYHMVAKIDVNANGSEEAVTIWVNPTSMLDTPIATRAAYSMNNTTAISVMSVSAQTFTGGVSFDEMRMATSWDDVVAPEPVPESGSVELLSIAPVSDSVMELVVDSDNPSVFYPETATELTANTAWSSVGHSTNGAAPFEVTNLSYSVDMGSNYVIYVEADQNQKFFRINSNIIATNNGIIAYDPFETDVSADAANGIYQAGLGIYQTANKSVEGGLITGFGASDWTGSTGIIRADSTGLTLPTISGARGGSVRYDGKADATVRAVRRPLDTYAGSSTYYVSMLMRSEVLETNGAAFGGFNSGNDAFIANGYGIFFGFVGNGSGMDLVVRQRQDLGGEVFGLTNTVLAAASADTTYHLVAKIDVNANESEEDVTIWINPTGMSDTPVTNMTAFSMNNETAISVMSVSASNFTGGVRFDEMKLKTNW